MGTQAVIPFHQYTEMTAERKQVIINFIGENSCSCVLACLLLNNPMAVLILTPTQQALVIYKGFELTRSITVSGQSPLQ